MVGFDDSPAAHQSEPALTTVRQDVAHKGRLAAAGLIEAIGRAGEGDGPQVLHEVLPTELVKRASTAPPPAG